MYEDNEWDTWRWVKHFTHDACVYSCQPKKYWRAYDLFPMTGVLCMLIVLLISDSSGGTGGPQLLALRLMHADVTKTCPRFVTFEDKPSRTPSPCLYFHESHGKYIGCSVPTNTSEGDTPLWNSTLFSEKKLSPFMTKLSSGNITPYIRKLIFSTLCVLVFIMRLSEARPMGGHITHHNRLT